MQAVHILTAKQPIDDIGRVCMPYQLTAIVVQVCPLPCSVSAVNLAEGRAAASCSLPDHVA